MVLICQIYDKNYIGCVTETRFILHIVSCDFDSQYQCI